jgi:hypothetical protein
MRKILADKLATSSVEVVQGQPGFLGHLAAGPASEHQHEFIFASIWANVDAVKARFLESNGEFRCCRRDMLSLSKRVPLTTTT